EEGQPWQRQLHEWMARCGAGLVLLTPAVLQRPKWVLKEAIILGWRLDIELPREFKLYFVLAPGTTRDDFAKVGFELAQFSATQLVPGTLADITTVDDLIAALKLPEAQPQTPFDELIGEFKNLLRIADPPGTTYADIASHLGMTSPTGWGPDKLDLLAQGIACAVVKGREDEDAISGLLDKLGAWTRENREKLVELLAPFWIDLQMAGSLMRRAPPTPVPQPPPALGPGTVTIAGNAVADFTAKMAVRRAFGQKRSKYFLAEAVGLNSGDLFDDIRTELCEIARKQIVIARGIKDDNVVVKKLRTYPTPIFVPIGTFPDAATLKKLREEFPRVVFIAPRPTDRGTKLTGDELFPDPDPLREQAAYVDWIKANGAL
ncbi:MAG: hypothetical protein ABW220_11280, partial [Burkholderiaceae bacterium]